jgi:hypothetical protein
VSDMFVYLFDFGEVAKRAGSVLVVRAETMEMKHADHRAVVDVRRGHASGAHFELLLVERAVHPRTREVFTFELVLAHEEHKPMRSAFSGRIAVVNVASRMVVRVLVLQIVFALGTRSHTHTVLPNPSHSTARTTKHSTHNET